MGPQDYPFRDVKCVLHISRRVIAWYVKRFEIIIIQFDFGTLFTAQARGDFAALVDRGRRVLRIDLGDSDLVASLDRLLADA